MAVIDDVESELRKACDNQALIAEVEALMKAAWDAADVSGRAGMYHRLERDHFVSTALFKALGEVV